MKLYVFTHTRPTPLYQHSTPTTTTNPKVMFYVPILRFSVYLCISCLRSVGPSSLLLVCIHRCCIDTMRNCTCPLPKAVYTRMGCLEELHCSQCNVIPDTCTIADPHTPTPPSPQPSPLFFLFALSDFFPSATLSYVDWAKLLFPHYGPGIRLDHITQHAMVWRIKWIRFFDHNMPNLSISFYISNWPPVSNQIYNNPAEILTLNVVLR